MCLCFFFLFFRQVQWASGLSIIRKHSYSSHRRIYKIRLSSFLTRNRIDYINTLWSCPANLEKKLNIMFVFCFLYMDDVTCQSTQRNEPVEGFFFVCCVWCSPVCGARFGAYMSRITASNRRAHLWIRTSNILFVSILIRFF